ncbi:MAG: tyrosine-type recombinase/integrase, partial [Candidatus Acidiferrales bacterium]
LVQGTLQRRFRVAGKAKGVTFEEFAQKYLAYAKCNKRSWKRDEQLIANLSCAFGGKRLAEIRSLDVEQYKLMRYEKAKPATVNREVALLKHMFNLAIQWEYTLDNPTRGVKLLREDNIVERILSPEEEERLLAEAHPGLKPVLITALNTGMRLGELLSLTWADVDLSRRLITVRHTKNGRVRRLPINDGLLEALKALHRKSSKAEYVFCSRRNGDRRKSVRTTFETAIRRAGISKLRFHDLRHTFATRLVAAGVDIVTVKELMGHRDISMTMRYAHSAPERSLDAVRRLEHYKSITICGVDDTGAGSAGSAREPISFATKKLAATGL